MDFGKLLMYRLLLQANSKKNPILLSQLLPGPSLPWGPSSPAFTVRHIFRGFFNFASRELVANLTTRKNIYLRSGRMNATCVRNISTPRSRI